MVPFVFLFEIHSPNITSQYIILECILLHYRQIRGMKLVTELFTNQSCFRHIKTKINRYLCLFSLSIQWNVKMRSQKNKIL